MFLFNVKRASSLVDVSLYGYTHLGLLQKGATILNIFKKGISSKGLFTPVNSLKRFFFLLQ